MSKYKKVKYSDLPLCSHTQQKYLCEKCFNSMLETIKIFIKEINHGLENKLNKIDNSLLINEKVSIQLNIGTNQEILDYIDYIPIHFLNEEID